MTTVLYDTNKVKLKRWLNNDLGICYELSVQDDDGKWNHTQLMRKELREFHFLLREELS